MMAATAVVNASLRASKGRRGAPAAWPSSPGSVGVTQSGRIANSVTHQTRI
jgi:hypothetical protein